MSEPNEPILRPDSAGSSAGEPKKEDTAGWAGDLFTWLQALTFALVIIMIVFTFFARIIGVDGHSMEPTLQDRDMLLLQCAGYAAVRSSASRTRIRARKAWTAGSVTCSAVKSP